MVGLAHDLMPDTVSEQVKLTVSWVLFQPFAFRGGLALPLMVGGVLSSLTVTEPVPELPSLSVAVDVMVVPVVFADWLSLAGVGPLPTPEPASVALQVIATLLLFHPAVLGAGLSAAVTVGPVLSRVNEAVPDPAWPVQALF